MSRRRHSPSTHHLSSLRDKHQFITCSRHSPSEIILPRLFTPHQLLIDTPRIILKSLFMLAIKRLLVETHSCGHKAYERNWKETCNSSNLSCHYVEFLIVFKNLSELFHEIDTIISEWDYLELSWAKNTFTEILSFMQGGNGHLPTNLYIENTCTNTIVEAMCKRLLAKCYITVKTFSDQESNFGAKLKWVLL